MIDDVIAELKAHADAKHLAGMLRFGIDNSRALGVRIPQVRLIAKSYKKNHELALQLWDTGIHEARIMASIVDDPAQVTEEQFDTWAKDFYSWDLCDQVCGNLFDRTPLAVAKAIEYSERPEEYVKRAGFVLMAGYAVHHKKAADEVFLQFLSIIEREAHDSRNFVKKAVNWALRQIGKCNFNLKAEAIASAERIMLQDNKAAKWIAQDALRELLSRP
ncbi:DNA alkylation repair protein [Mucilaginibacter psychrotolerans]|uniref:DNA alkylation repair protein n=1 Tax=Mucilaginibacter psychrotolerans TaxID=1524096 RepID=A0A4Y8SI59_9SPHI|nr:DNA alkylation repair protein [Mucilaginibacter psychrotolerans]TFF38739.1 DNA alkylation repair protein [Mucilaginibacter psychrotolerans]